MTPPPARTGNEQRIAALEAEVVTMREAMEQITQHPIENEVMGRRSHGIRGFASCQSIARSTLSSSTDYANKVVVDREALEHASNIIKLVIRDYPSIRFKESLEECTFRLDSIRKQGGGE